MNTKIDAIQINDLLNDPMFILNCTNIDIHIDGINHNENKNAWLTVADNSLFYLYWNTGRVYFLLNNPHQDIQNITINRKTNIMKFDCNTKHFIIKIYDNNDFNKLVSLMYFF